MSIVVSRSSSITRPTASTSPLVYAGVLWRVLMPLRTVSLGSMHHADVGSIGYGVGSILFWRSIGQVGKMIIERIAIKVSNSGSRLAFWARPKECQGHEVMNQSLSAAHFDLGITAPVPFLAHVNCEVASSRPSTATRTDHSRPFLVDEVAGKSWDFMEFIHAPIIAVA